MKLISVDFHGDFGFFKKPDINDTIFLTYNFIHKPVVLGIFGAIIGLTGYIKSGELSEYYEKLKDLKIAIEPIGNNHNKGNFEKILVKYNDSTGFSSSEKGGVLNILEQVLVKPSYRIYIYVDENNNFHSELKEKLEKQQSVFIPYFGKNEFHCWWDNFKEYNNNNNLNLNLNSNKFKIKSIFKKPENKTLKELKEIVAFELSLGLKNKFEETFAIFERLPVGFDKTLQQYLELEEFVYTNIIFDKKKFSIDDNLKKIGENHKEIDNVIYLF